MAPTSREAGCSDQSDTCFGVFGLLDRDYFFAVDLGAAFGHQYAKNASGIHSKGN
jgi:hypothetical protein